MSKGKIMITMIIGGTILGFCGWITSDSAAVTTIAAANRWLVVAYTGAALTAIGFILLATGWGRNDK